MWKIDKCGGWLIAWSPNLYWLCVPQGAEARTMTMSSSDSA